jgi:hypothetical protein
MNLKTLGANKTELDLGDGHRVLVSYSTAVAESYLAPEGRLYRVTDKFWSRTTSKHIRSWMPLDDAKEFPQSYFDNLLAEVK